MSRKDKMFAELAKKYYELEAEITQLRAELDLERQHHANTEILNGADRGVIEELRRELAAERELADRLAAQLKSWTGDDSHYPDDVDALTAHATRRNK